MIENEFKIMLSKEQYDAIHTLYSWDTEVEQVNLARLNRLQSNSPGEESEDHDNRADKKQRTFK